MIRDRAHAEAIQKRRMEAGKAGYAKAVRRWFQRQANPDELYDLPVLRPAPAEEEEAA